MAAGVLGGEGVLDHKLHGGAGRPSSDRDVVLGWFFRGDGTGEKGVVATVWWMGKGVVICGAVVEFILSTVELPLFGPLVVGALSGLLFDIGRRLNAVEGREGCTRTGLESCSPGS